MSSDKKCAMCKNVFRPRSYKHKMCSDKCRQEWKKKYASELAESGYFLQYQRENNKLINDRNNARYGVKIGRKNGMLPAKQCKKCSETFVPKYNNRQFCTSQCSAKYRYRHRHEKKTDSSLKISICGHM